MRDLLVVVGYVALILAPAFAALNVFSDEKNQL